MWTCSAFGSSVSCNMPRLTSHPLEISVQILLQVFQQLNYLFLSPLCLGFLEHFRHLPVVHFHQGRRCLLLTFRPLMNQKSYQQSLLFIQIGNLLSLRLGITSVRLFQGTLESKTKTTTGFSFVSWSLFISKLLNVAFSAGIKTNKELNLSK